jgi:hypothetical protein
VALADAVRKKLSHERFDSLSERLADISRLHYPAREAKASRRLKLAPCLALHFTASARRGSDSRDPLAMPYLATKGSRRKSPRLINFIAQAAQHRPFGPWRLTASRVWPPSAGPAPDELDNDRLFAVPSDLPLEERGIF